MYFLRISYYCFFFKLEHNKMWQERQDDKGGGREDESEEANVPKTQASDETFTDFEVSFII